MKIEDAFLVLSAIAPADRPAGPTDGDDVYGRDELEQYLERQHYLGECYKEACVAGLQARQVASNSEYFGLPAELQLKAMEAYTTYVMTALWLQASTEEWGMPTSWVMLQPADNDGYIAVYNAGAEENTNWQGEDVDYIRIDETGLTIKAPGY
jgi:hypothetical protein